MSNLNTTHIQANETVTACGRGVARHNGNVLTRADAAAATCKACISAHSKALATGRYGRLNIALN